jgi:hypothetical protein
MKKKSVYLKLNDDLEVIVQGDYCSPEDETNFGGQFDITKIDVVEGTLIDYTYYIEGILSINSQIILIDHLSELALLKLNECLKT